MEKIWLQSYEAGINPEINVNEFTSIVDVFNQSVNKFANRPAFTNFGVTLTYQETQELVNQFTSYLQNGLKLPKGERVAIMMPNVLQYPIAVFGILQAGCIVVNINPLYTPRELELLLNDADVSTIIVLENFANTLELVLPKTSIKHVIIASIGEMLGFLKGNLVNFVLRKIKKMVPNYQIANAITFKNALNEGKQYPLNHLVPLSLNDTAFLQYTGGTTGDAKGAELSHANIIANMLQGGEWIKGSLESGREIIVTALPLYHVFSLTINLMIFIKDGAQNILITNPRDIAGFIKEMKKYKVSIFSGVNTLFNALFHHPDFSSIDFSTWKISIGGGMAVQKNVAKEWKRITGTPIIEAYGLTEASPGVCVNPLNIEEYTGSIGLPIPSTDIEIRGANNQVLGVGETGELWVKGPQVMKGYWKNPEETAKVIDDRGFLATGDVAEINEKGFLRLVDRKKDMIVVSGFNVYPNEVEDVVTSMPGILEAACIGIDSEKTGEALKLFVVKKDQNVTREAIIKYCRENLTAYKVPKDIEFRDELPKSNVGKILRKELRPK